MKSKSLLLALLAVVAVLAGVFWKWGNQIEFVGGGALVNLGYRLQDPLEEYDFEHHDPTAENVWSEFVKQNRMASLVRDVFPRSARHPVIAMVICMDARLDTSEIAGDTRRYYYILRLAGSVLSPKEEDMLELAVANGTKVVIFTTHTDCAAEKMYRDPEQRPKYPALSTALEERDSRLREFVARPMIKDKLASKQLIVKRMTLDTANDRVVPMPDL
ncbi:MAG: carbonic anhydrase [Bryobacteraceae bacterium]